MLKKFFLVLLLLCTLSIPQSLSAETAPSTLAIQNEFIKLIINNEPYDTGRFSVETIGGDPSRTQDDLQPLIFGRPKPWTSYTTFNIDGKAHIFGGQTKKRAGRDGIFGTVLAQVATSDAIQTTVSFNAVTVTQTLQFFRSPLTKVNDTALISYEILNTDSVTHNVGTRIMLDTMLGTNDGAPFRIGAYAYQAEQMFVGKDIQEYWQTFDQIASPNVIAQGTLTVPEHNITAPDKMYLVNWGTLADNPWDFEYEAGRPFVRAGELDKDTALAMYWSPVAIPPSSSVVVKTLYGLGGITLAAGDFSLGLTAPAEISSVRKDPILIVGYILNSGGFDAQNVEATFDLPDGFSIVEGSRKIFLDTIGAGGSRQVALKVKINNAISTGEQFLKLSVSSDTLESNSISRKIEILGPPKIQAWATSPKKVIAKRGSYFDTKLTVKNPNSYPLNDLTIRLTPPKGILVPSYEKTVKEIGSLGPKSLLTLDWKLQIEDPKESAKPLIFTLTNPILQPKRVQHNLNLFDPEQKMSLSLSRDALEVDDYFYVWLVLKNPKPFQNFTGAIEIDGPAKLIRSTPELWLQNSNQVSAIEVSPKRVEIRGLKNDTKGNGLRILKLHYRALASKPITFTLNSEGQILDRVTLTPESKP